jgi:hypothetical protein
MPGIASTKSDGFLHHREVQPPGAIFELQEPRIALPIPDWITDNRELPIVGDLNPKGLALFQGFGLVVGLGCRHHPPREHLPGVSRVDVQIGP